MVTWESTHLYVVVKLKHTEFCVSIETFNVRVGVDLTDINIYRYYIHTRATTVSTFTATSHTLDIFKKNTNSHCQFNLVKFTFCIPMKYFQLSLTTLCLFCGVTVSSFVEESTSGNCSQVPLMTKFFTHNHQVRSQILFTTLRHGSFNEDEHKILQSYRSD